MDDIVRQALAKWPNVPACYGWLLLDRRGNWRMRDDAVQRAHGLGSPVRHAALIAFIVRNYDVDELGQWYFQNGPQRVYLELEYTPFVVRLARVADDTLELTDQTGARWEPDACWSDDRGAVIFSGHVEGSKPQRVAVLHDHDLDLFADCLDGGDVDGEVAERGDGHDSEAREHEPPSVGDSVGSASRFLWRRNRALTMGALAVDDIAARFGFVKSPADVTQRTEGQ